MEKGMGVLAWIAVVVFVLSLGYFLFSVGVFTGSVVDGSEELIESGDVLPEIYAESSPNEGEGSGCSWESGLAKLTK